MYSSLCSCVRLDNQMRTEYFSCNIGTRQGCKLSPILFSLLINELLEELKQSGIRGIQIPAECDEILALGYTLVHETEIVRKNTPIVRKDKTCLKSNIIISSFDFWLLTPRKSVASYWNKGR